MSYTKRFLFSLALWLSSISGLSGTVILRNERPYPCYCRFYYVTSTSSYAGEPAGAIHTLKGGETISLREPETQFLASRVFACTPIKEALPDNRLPAKESLIGSLMPIGIGSARDFILIDNPTTDRPELLTLKDWQLERAREAARIALESQSPYYAHPAQVETVTAPHPRDILHLRQRAGHIEKTGKKSGRIALCLSGGGFRAMTATMGLLKGLKEIDYLDHVIAAAALSGSSWALAPWIAHACSLERYSSQLSRRLMRGLMGTPDEVERAYEHFKKQKNLFNIPPSSIDFYGIALSTTLLHPLKTPHTDHTLSSLAESFDPTIHPIPLFTAATQNASREYQWVFCTPWTMYGPTGHHTIPTWSFGRHFANGVSIDHAPEPMLGYYLGIFGSSFSMSVRDFIERAPSFLSGILKSILPEQSHASVMNSSWANRKFSPALVPNFLAKYSPAGAYQDEEHLCLVDGGYLNNLPLVPLLAFLDGEVDLIIILDCRREHDTRLSNYEAAVTAARAGGFALPSISPQNVLHSPITLALAEEEGSPSLLFISLLPDESTSHLCNPILDRVYATPQFSYTTEQYHQLEEFVALRARQARELIELALFHHRERAATRPTHSAASHLRSPFFFKPSHADN